MLTIAQWLQKATDQLAEAGIATARLDSLVLLEDSTGIDRAQLLAHPERRISDTDVRRLHEQIAERAAHMPLAYIRGKTEFYGRMFMLDRHVLEPRPESETMIDMLKRLPDTRDLTIVDVGTGSGALAITAKLELPESNVVATDIDDHCLKLATRNAAALHAEIDIRRSDLLQPNILPMSNKHTNSRIVLLCNLPYVPEDFHINQAAMHEPRLAIFGGPDGLDVYRRLFEQLAVIGLLPDYILTESLPPQHDTLTQIAARHNYMRRQTDDFIQLFSPGSSL